MFDFTAIARRTPHYNFHSHTQFCDGRATMAEFATAAEAAGFEHYGFSPHSPVPIASPCNMRTDQVEEYLAEVERQRREHPGVHFYASMEIDYLGPEWGPANPYFQALPLDYRIGSVHFVPAKDGSGPVDIDGSPERFAANMATHFGNDLRYVTEAYFSQEIAMLAAGGFDLLAHCDKVAQNGITVDPDIESRPWYRAGVDALIDAIVKAGVTVEINTKHYASMGRLFPAPDIIDRLRRAQVPMVVNSDAHYTHLIDANRHIGLGKLSDNTI